MCRTNSCTRTTPTSTSSSAKRGRVPRDPRNRRGRAEVVVSGSVRAQSRMIETQGVVTFPASNHSRGQPPRLRRQPQPPSGRSASMRRDDAVKVAMAIVFSAGCLAWTAVAAWLTRDPPASDQVHAAVDHVILGVADLDRGCREFENLTGVQPRPGGRHPGAGTRNALVPRDHGTRP
jgi:hypothetical protein